MIYRLTENDVNAMIAEAAIRILESRNLLREMDWDDQWEEFTEGHPEEYEDPQTRKFQTKQSGKPKKGNKGKKSNNPDDEDNSGQENLTNTKGGKDDKDELLQVPTVAGSVKKYLTSIGSQMNPKMDADALPPPQPPMMPGAPMPGAPMPGAPMMGAPMPM